MEFKQAPTLPETIMEVEYYSLFIEEFLFLSGPCSTSMFVGWRYLFVPVMFSPLGRFSLFAPRSVGYLEAFCLIAKHPSLVYIISPSVCAPPCSPFCYEGTNPAKANTQNKGPETRTPTFWPLFVYRLFSLVLPNRSRLGPFGHSKPHRSTAIPVPNGSGSELGAPACHIHRPPDGT